jgi:malate dehydrogenase (oxaloacetate-decarboxylating)
MKNKKSKVSVYQKSLQIHQKHRGKIEISLKLSINNKDDLSLAYSPGVAEVSRAIAKKY